jgi:hypothetical protein
VNQCYLRVRALALPLSRYAMSPCIATADERPFRTRYSLTVAVSKGLNEVMQSMSTEGFWRTADVFYSSRAFLSLTQSRLWLTQRNGRKTVCTASDFNQFR